MNNIQNDWNLIKEKISEEYELSDISYATWIEPLILGSVTDDSVVILIPSNQSHALNYINKKYREYFKVTISEMYNRNYEIEFRLEKDQDAKNVLKIGSDPVYNIDYENANLNPKYKFNSFVVGGSNNFAYSAALAVAESPGEIYNPLYLYGGAGLGKTHLMHSIGHFILENNPNTSVLYVTTEQFTNEVIESVRSKDAGLQKKIRDKYRSVDVLMLDDVQFIIGKEGTQLEFFNTFNALHSAGKQIIISSDRPPKEMETLEERLKSRFEMGLIADIQPPDYETRMAILIKKAESVNRPIDEEVLKYIATNIKSNIRELEGAFTKIVAYSKLKNVEINIENAEDALKDIVYPDKPVDITPSYILDKVCDQYRVTVSDVTSKKRNAELVEPRQVVMYLCRDLTDASLSDVGKLLGGKDHTTIMHGVKNIEKKISDSDEFDNKVKSIKKKITEG
jgi:chromosomal replication initiator protein